MRNRGNRDRNLSPDDKEIYHARSNNATALDMTIANSDRNDLLENDSMNVDDEIGFDQV